MQTRERYLAIAVGGLVGLWLLDTLVLSPTLAWYQAVQSDTHATERTVAEAKILVDNADRIRADWRGQHAAGLLDDEDAARFRLQQIIATSARTSGVVIDSVSGGQRIPAPHGKAYDTVRLSLSGQGSLNDIQTFLAGLDQVGQPLRIERCEMAARDGRKDQLDLALTVSTRFANRDARATRRVVTGQKTWQPAAHDAAADADVLAAKPFLSDRRSGKVVTTSSADNAAPAPAGWALVGIVSRIGAAQAFVRNLGDNSERLLTVGDHIDDTVVAISATVTAINETGMTLMVGKDARLIAVGADFNGQPAIIGKSASIRGATSAGASSLSTTPAPSEADRNAILQRLREQRNRSR